RVPAAAHVYGSGAVKDYWAARRDRIRCATRSMARSSAALVPQATLVCGRKRLRVSYLARSVVSGPRVAVVGKGVQRATRGAFARAPPRFGDDDRCFPAGVGGSYWGPSGIRGLV